MGIELFLAKHNINHPDEAIESLYQYALTQAYQYKAIDKLTENDKAKVLHIIANYAFQDYSRSAASKKFALIAVMDLLKLTFLLPKAIHQNQLKGLSEILKMHLK